MTTSVGSVSLDFYANTQELDRAMRELERRAIESANRIESQFGRKLFLKPIVDDSALTALNKHLDLKQRHFDKVQQQFNSRPLTPLVNTANIERLTGSVQALQERLRDPGGFPIPSVNVSTSRDENQTRDSTSSPLTLMQAEMEAGMAAVASTMNAKIEQAIGNSLKGIANTASAPFRQVLTGLFEGVGMNISNILSRSGLSAFQKSSGISLDKVGAISGAYAGRVINELRGRSGVPDNGASPKRSTHLADGRVVSSPPLLPKSGGGTTNEIKGLHNQLQEISKQLQNAASGLNQFDGGVAQASTEILHLASALTKLYGTIHGLGTPVSPANGGGLSSVNNSAKTNSTISSAPLEQVSLSENKKAPANLKTIKPRGFLRGDKAELTPEAARAQVEAVRDRLQKRLDDLRQIPGGASSKQIGVLMNALATVQNRIATDIADPEIPQSVRRSLGQLRGVNSKLSQTRRDLVSVAGRVGFIDAQRAKGRGGLGVARIATGAGVGASILGAGGAFAAPGAGIGGLGFLGSLPFDPTLGLAAAGALGSLAAARFAPKLIRKAGATKLADVLETNVNDLVKNIATSLGELFRRAKDRSSNIARQARRKISSDIIIPSTTRQYANPKPLGNEVDNSSKQRPPRNITPPPTTPTTFSKLTSHINTTFQNIIAGAKSTANNIVNSLKITGKVAPDRGISTSDLGKKIDEIQSQIDKIVLQVQQDLLKKTGKLFSPEFVRDALNEGIYHDPRYAAARKQQQFLEKQHNRNYNETIENKERTSVNKLTGRRKLIAEGDEVFKQLRDAQAKIDAAARKAQQEILKETGQRLSLPHVKNLLRSGVRNSGDYASGAQEKQQLVNSLRQKERAAIAPKPSTSNTDVQFWDNFFRSLEARFFRSALFRGNVPAKERRNLTAEATGFLFSGAAFAAPGATLGLLVAPVIASLTPLITTIGLVGSALAPLVGTIATQLKQTDPIRARLEYVSGGARPASENRAYVQGIAEKYNIAALPSLDQFSKLAAATKGTRLEGDGLKSLFEGIATAAKGLSLNTEDLNLVMYAFTQIASKGKLSAEEVRLQLAEKFPGIINILAKSLDMTVPEFNKVLEQGKLISEDVLPKLGQALQREYGEAASRASGNFLSALTKVDNAIFRLKDSVSQTLAPVFATVTSVFGDAINVFAQNAQKLVPILSVVLVGAAAQFFVGLTVILEGSGVLSKLQAFMIPLFGRLFATLTPFAAGIFADFLDDVFGAKTSVMDNMMKGFYNIVLVSLLALDDLRKNTIAAFGDIQKFATYNFQGVGKFFGGIIPKQDNEVLDGVGSAFNGIGKALQWVKQAIAGTPVEFASLFLILAQTYVLLEKGLVLVAARFGATIGSLAMSFARAVASGKVFNSVLNTLTAGLNRGQLAATAATTAIILFFAKADFSNELGSSFDKIGDRMASSLDKIRIAAKAAGKELDNLSPPTEIESKGFDYTLGFGETFGFKPFKNDDYTKLLRQLAQKAGGFYKQQGWMDESSYQMYLDRYNKQQPTIGEKQFNDNLGKLKDRSQQLKESLDISGLMNGSFSTNEFGAILADIKKIDASLKELGKKRVDLLAANPDSKETTSQVADIDKEIGELLQKRGKIKQPLEGLKNSILEEADALKENLELINNSTLPEKYKRIAREQLQPSIDLAEQARKKLEELGLIDLSPLITEFSRVTTEVEKLDKALEKSLSHEKLKSTIAQIDIQSRLSRGEITPAQAKRQSDEQDLSSMRNNERFLSDYVRDMRSKLRELLSIPNPNINQQETIDKVRLDLDVKELDLQSTRLSIAQKSNELESQLKELGKTVEDYYRSIQRTSAEVALAAKQAANIVAVTSAKTKLKAAILGFQDNFVAQFVDSLVAILDQLNEPLQQAIDAQGQLVQNLNQHEEAIRQGQEQRHQHGVTSSGINSRVDTTINTGAYTVYSGGKAKTKARSVNEHHGGGSYSEQSFNGKSERFLGDRLVKDIVLEQNGKQSVPVPSPVAGIARLVSSKESGGYGNLVEVLNAQGHLVARIAHLASIAPGLQSGSPVAYGQSLGIQGNTGNSTGTHLHIELPPSLFEQYFNDLRRGIFTSPLEQTSRAGATNANNSDAMTRLLHIIAGGESDFNPRAENTEVAAGNRPRGAFQFIPRSRARAIELTGLDPWAGSLEQQARAAKEWIRVVHPKAYSATNQGALDTAIKLLRSEWTSLPGAKEDMKWHGAKGQALLQQYVSGNFTPKFSLSTQGIVGSRTSGKVGDVNAARADLTHMSAAAAGANLRSANSGVIESYQSKTLLSQASTALQIEQAFRQFQQGLRDQRSTVTNFGRRDEDLDAEDGVSTPQKEYKINQRNIQRKYTDFYQDLFVNRERLQRTVGGTRTSIEAIKKQLAGGNLGEDETNLYKQALTELTKQSPDTLVDLLKVDKLFQAQPAKLDLALNSLAGKYITSAITRAADFKTQFKTQSIELSRGGAARAETFQKRNPFDMSMGDPLLYNYQANVAETTLSFEKTKREYEESGRNRSRSPSQVKSLIAMLEKTFRQKLLTLTEEYEQGIEDRDIQKDDFIFGQKQRYHESNQNLLSTKSSYLKTKGFNVQSQRLEKTAAIASQEFNYTSAIREIEKLVATNQISINKASELKSDLSAINAIKLDDIRAQFDVWNNVIVETQSSFQNFLSGIISGSSSIGDAFKGMVQSIANNLSNLAAQYVSNEIFKVLIGGKSGFGTSNVDLAIPQGEGEKGGFNLSSLFASSGDPSVQIAAGAMKIFGLKDGGVVEAVDHSDLRKGKNPIARALQKEGNRSVLAALTPGEMVLNLEQTRQYHQLGMDRVLNFREGGVVPGGGTMPNFKGGSGNPVTVNIPVSINSNGGGNNSDMAKTAAGLGQVLKAAVMQEIQNQKRPGGLLQGI